jgi:hypothetical protein
MNMKRFGVLLASAALGAALTASGHAAAMGGSFGGGHMGGGFGGGHMGGGFGGGHMGGGFGGGHMGGGFGGRNMAVGGFHRGFNRGFDHRFARFDHFHRFNHFNRFSNQFDFVGGVYGDCGFWGDSYCGYGYPGYANGYGYPDYAYSYPNYGYPATGFSGYYAAAPLVTGQSVATGQLGSYCTISVKACEADHSACSCWPPGGRATVAH